MGQNALHKKKFTKDADQTMREIIEFMDFLNSIKNKETSFLMDKY